MAITILGLTAIAIIPIAFSGVFALLIKKTNFGKLNPALLQIIIGIAFGLLAILGTEYGIDVGGAKANARDAAPLCAGLLFGAPAGIIAGTIGAVERWFATLWGAGAYTRLACTISTFIAGIVGAAIRKFIFNNKRTSWFYTLAVGPVTETFHMLMIFITNMNDIRNAFTLVQKCAFPMITVNALAVMLASIIVDWIKGTHRTKAVKNKLAFLLQRGLFQAVLLAFLVTSGFTYVLQSHVSRNDTRQLLSLNIEDVILDMQDIFEDSSYTNGEKLGKAINDVAANRHLGNGGSIMVMDSNCNIVSHMRGSDLTGAFTSTIKPEMLSTNPDNVFSLSINGSPYFAMYQRYEGYYILALYPENEAVFSMNITVYINLFMEIIVYAILFILIYIVTKKQIVDNIETVNNSLAKITDGNLDEVVNVRTCDEFVSLSDDINQTVDALKKYIAEAEARIDKELEIAKTIQFSALPSVSPNYDNREEFDICAGMFPAKEVGGDFYDFYYTNADHTKLAFLIADVSGKGIPAAMFMMSAKPFIKTYAETGAKLSEVFTHANAHLCAGNDEGMFVTAWMGSIDLKTGEFEYVNAGHNPPVIKRGDKFEYFRTKPGFVLAGIEDFEYTSDTIKLEPGDIVFLYTDGVTEATNIDNELFGEDRLLETLNNAGHRSAAELSNIVHDAVNDFVGDAPQFDDITMVCFEYVPGHVDA